MEQEWPQQAPAPMPERDVRDPAPTVAVPYRVVQKGRPQHRSNEPQPAARSATAATNASQDWGDDPDRDW